LAESTSNVEYAHRIHEQGHEHGHGPSDRHHEWVALSEAIVLAIVAVATAWSGYQAAKWDALSAKQYALNATTMILSQETSTTSGQYRLYDVLTFNGWMYANATGNERLKALYERRFRPALKVAFDDWLKLDPMHNPDAPAGPGLMPSFKDPYAQEATRLAEQAKTYFEEATSARETGDQYVKVTVLLATVLLLTALSQRFKPLGPRVIVVSIAFVLLLASMTLLIKLPRT
jgi:hypothetical protein